ncbi:MAG: 4Fe-4S dicluster domain-containing protein [candidate division WOR-3 bacterium]
MKPGIITAQELARLVAEWAKTSAVFAPVRVKNWTEFRRISSLDEADLTHVNTKLSARSLLFPQCETMFRFRTDQPAKPEEPALPEKQVILGIRPCDAAGIALLDRFFCGQGETDTYYQRRRTKTVLVGLACNAPADTCFCSAVGGSPAGLRGLDLLLTDLGDRYLAEPVTDAGAGLLIPLGETLRPATDADMAKKQELAEQAGAAITERIDTPGLKALLDNSDQSPMWEELSLACVNCGACTFVCPTCHCFDVTDETGKGQGARIRIWDTCQACLYSQHASGHNPRATPAARFRNRTMDKFRYTVEIYGEVSCVGCGRCIVECPTSIDIRETVEILMRTLSEK